MLSIGAALLGARHVVGVDVDPDALEVAQDNVGEFEDPLPVSGGRQCVSTQSQGICEAAPLCINAQRGMAACR